MTSLKSPLWGLDLDLETRLSQGSTLSPKSLEAAAKILKNIHGQLPDDKRNLSEQLIDYIVNTGKKSISEAQRDELTGLYNQSYFKARLDDEAHRCQRYGDTFTLVFFDLDNFKPLNDTFGHMSGDMTLGTVGKILTRETRAADVAARYGGDEFAVILPQTPIENAAYMCKRIRAYLNRKKFKDNKGVETMLGASFGIATYEPELDGREVLRRADDALYSAKDEGKNMIHIYASDDSFIDADKANLTYTPINKAPAPTLM